MPSHNWDKTSSNDRPEVVVTDETNGYYTKVDSAQRAWVNAKASDEDKDSFGRIKISNPTTLMELNHRFGKYPNYWHEKITGSATSTLLSNRASVKMSVTSATNDEVIRQTRRYYRYFAGKGQAIIFTGSFDTGTSGVRKRYGYFDDRNGIFFELDGTTLYAVIRSYVSGSVVETKVAQSSWNADKLDGTGDSGLTLDLSKQLIMNINFQWLGSGRVAVGFTIGNTIVFAHFFDHSNVVADPYTSTGDLPLRAEIKNVSGPSAADLFLTCFTVLSDGGTVEEGFIRSIGNGTTEISVDTSETALIAMRMKSAVNRNSVKPLIRDLLMSAGSNIAKYRIYFNPTISATWSDSDDGIIEFSSGTSITSFSSGTTIESGYIPTLGRTSGATGGIIESDLYLGRDIDGTSDIMLITAEMLAGNGKVVSSVSYREYK
jgi:hypothetical protein